MKTKIFIILLVTFGFLIWVLRDIDTHEAMLALKNTNPIWVCMMFFGHLCSHLLRSARLWILLEYKTSYRRVFSINTIGFLAINVMPMRLGEAVRPYLFSEREAIPFGEGLAAIFMERLLDVLMLLLMLMVMGFVISLPEQGLEIAGIDVVQAGQAAAGGIVIVGVLAILALIFVGPFILSWLARFQILEPLINMANKFRSALITLFSKPLRAGGLVLLSMVVWLITISSVMMALWSFEGLPHGFDAAWSCWTVTLAGMTAIPTPGFFGVYELCCSKVLSLWGIGQTLSTTFALFLHLGQLMFITVLGSGFMIAEGLSLRALRVPTKE
ncbi:MAG: hypothetical protein CL916_01100 [Deltaproteobacteria bacterium]|nr:hypothetical protein [Deltaproteobacteria bacterium]